MTAFENLSTNEKIRVALHRDVGAICKESCHYRGFEITIPATAIIAELVFKKISVYGLDLEAFAKHAKRSTINSEDVKLLVRRNPSLRAHIDKLCVNKPSVNKEKRRKTSVAKVPAKKKMDKNISDGSSSPLQKKRKINDEPCIKNELERPKDEVVLADDPIDLTFD